MTRVAIAAFVAAACLLPRAAAAHWGLTAAPRLTAGSDTLIVDWSAASADAAWQLRDRFDDDGDGALAPAEVTALLRFCAARVLSEGVAPGVTLEQCRIVPLEGLGDPVASTAPLAVQVRISLTRHSVGRQRRCSGRLQGQQFRCGARAHPWLILCW